MQLSFKLLDRADLLGEQDRLFYNISINSGIATYLDDVRREASNFIRRNPNHLGYKALKSLPDKLTERTGALLAGLKEGDRYKGDRGWVGLSKTRANTDTSIFKTFHGRVVQSGSTVKGTWSPFVRFGSAAIVKKYLAYRKYIEDKPLEQRFFDLSKTKQSVYFSALWELRGRPYMQPASDKIQNTFDAIMVRSFGIGIKKFGLDK